MDFRNQFTMLQQRGGKSLRKKLTFTTMNKNLRPNYKISMEECTTACSSVNGVQKKVLGIPSCVEDMQYPLFQLKITAKPGDGQGNKKYSCCLVFWKFNCYLLGFGKGIGPNVEVPFYTFEDSPINCGFEVVNGLSASYEADPAAPPFLVNGNKLFDAVKAVFLFTNDGGVVSIAQHIKYLIWSTIETIRSLRTRYAVAESFRPCPMGTWWNREYYRDDNDWEFAHTWEQTSRSYVDGTPGPIGMMGLLAYV